MKTIKVIKTGATAVETRKQLRKGANKVEVESRPNVGPELEELLKEFKHAMKSKARFMNDNKALAKKFGLFEPQVKLLKELTGYGEENKAKKESLKRRTGLQNVR